MNQLIQNYINGNLAAARRQAKRHDVAAIYRALRNIGYSGAKASLTAHWLKTGEGWQSACDAA